MLWIIQKNLDNENRREELINALVRLNINYLEVIVHHNTITPDIEDNTQPIITNGSIMLSSIARNRGWTPGSLTNDNYDYNVWSEHYKDFILNKNAVITTIEEAKPISDKIFARPLLDNKTFNGRVFTADEFLDFQKKSIAGDKNAARPDTKMLMSQVKKIGQEHRHYIVDGEIVTSSRYKLAGNPNFSEGCDQEVQNVVGKAIKLWTPARAFVMDTYIAGSEVGIVEIGSICHAGLYRADILKLVNALDSMELSPPSTKIVSKTRTI